MNNKKIFLSIFLILFLVSIAGVSAQDNVTDKSDTIEMADNVEKIDVNTDDIAIVDSDYSTASVSSSDSKNDKVGLDTEDDVYFNASAKYDGDGTRNNPFKYLTDDRFPYGCTAYFANGVYEISDTCRAQSNDGSDLFDVPTKVTIIGESTTGVIFKGINSSAVAFKVLDNSRLYVYNATFDNAIVQNNGRFEAYGAVFKNGVAIDTTASYYPTRNNAFGGAIYSPGSNYYLGYGMKSYLTLENCYFINNSAVYGGSIYHKYGDTIIRNTKFINSYASLYGGVLATDGGDIIIENCEFLNCHAAGDAGGAIYSKVTNLTVKNSNFTNGLGDFGGAICNLNSDLIIENCNFNNNTAKLEGGAVYAMYGTVLIKNCDISISSARDGGAVFVDNCTDVEIISTNFDKSSATRYGGTIFSNGINITLTDVEFGESSALIGPVVYHQEKYDYDIGYNSDYQMMKYNSSFTGVLPSYYNLVEEGYVTPVRDQEGGGNCWAFAGIAALESCIYKATGKNIDLSEENVKNLIELYSAYGWKLDTNDGGHSQMTWGNLISWLGPVLEEDDKYDDYSTLSTLLNAVMHVQNVYYLPVRTSALDNYAMKKALMDYGAVSVLMYADFDNPLNYDENTASYYFATGTKGYANHAVTIVGWDDNYDKSKFPMGDMAGGNGAWIVKNSWNTDWGDNGYFYVSYYDPVVFELNEKNVAYTFILNDTVRYNRNYQYDIGGMTDYFYPTGNNKTLYYKNTFTAIASDYLSAVSTIFEDAIDYELKIFINDELKLTQNGHSFAGYATIPLNKEFLLNTGDKFTVQFKISKDGGASIPICEVVTATRLTYSEGISFFSTDGKNWNDLYSYSLDRPDIEHRYASQVACIKAFTRSSGITHESTITVENITIQTGESKEIVAIVKDENGNLINTGFVSFNIANDEFTIKVDNGRAELEVEFDTAGTYDVFARYNGGYNFKNSTTTAKITVQQSQVKKSTKLTVPNVELKSGDSTITATLTDSDNKAISGVYVTLNINNVDYTSKTDSNGVATFNPTLTAGKYIATVQFAGSNNYDASSQTAFVEVINDTVPVQNTTDDNNTNSTKPAQNNTTSKLGIDTVIIVDSTFSRVATDYWAGERGALFYAVLQDINGNPLANKTVQIAVNGPIYFVTTDSQGRAGLQVNLNAANTYTYALSFQGDDTYEGSLIASSKLTVTKKSTSISASAKTFKASKKTKTVSVTLKTVKNPYDGKTYLKSGKKITLKVNGKTYTAKTNAKGVAKFTIKLTKKGKYTAKISFAGDKTYKASSKSVKITIK